MKAKEQGLLSAWWLALLIGLTALLVYVLTLTPSLSYVSPDGSELATIPYILGLAHSPGYPLYTWLGFLFSHLLPFGDVAYRMNLMSGVLGALGVAGLYLITQRMLTSIRTDVHPWLIRLISATVALLFAFSKDFWSQALIAEVYAPNIGIIAITLLILLWWEQTLNPWIYTLFALTFGLSLGTHLSNLGFAPAMGLYTLLTLLYTTPPSQARQKSTWQTLLTTIASGLTGFLLGIAQFVWLPLRADTLNDRAMLRKSPISLKGIYQYTLGAFPNFKFAFSLPQLPERLVIYLHLLNQQYTIVGIVAGVIGLFALLYRKPRHFFLVFGMYLIHVWFFIQYNVFDLEVFFIPAHFLWGIFIAFGIWEITLLGNCILKKFAGRKWARKSLIYLLFLALTSAVFLQFQRSWEVNDLSSDTAVNDFYANLWHILPEDAVLVTPAGVFGYDAFYWQLVYNIRPDITLPTLPTPDPSPKTLQGKEIFATTSAVKNNHGPGALPPNLVSQNAWYIPLLVGEQPMSTFGRREALILYRLSDDPPDLKINNPSPEIPLQKMYNGYRLLGVDATPQQLENGSALHLRLYWQITSLTPDGNLPRLRVGTIIGDTLLEQHEVGFGNLARYQKEMGLTRGDTFVDEYYLVMPSTLTAGTYPLSIANTSLTGDIQQQATLLSIEVEDNIPMFEHWLALAQKQP